MMRSNFFKNYSEPLVSKFNELNIRESMCLLVTKELILRLVYKSYFVINEIFVLHSNFWSFDGRPE